MKVISITEPYASLIKEQKKLIETRSWKTNYRGPIAIHAGKKIDKSVFEDPFYCDILNKYGITKDNIVTSAILGVGILSDIKRTEDLVASISEKEKKLGTYTENRYGWFIKEIRELETPLFYKGSLGLWNLNLDL